MPERLQVDVTIAAQPRVHVATAAHEGRRIQDDHLEAIPCPVQVLEHVGLDEFGRRRIEPVLAPGRIGQLEGRA